MIEETYGITATTSMSVEDAEAAIRTALGDEGFGILTEIDLAATFKAKLEVDRTADKILGACNPARANRAVGIDAREGLLLPCNVIIAASSDGAVVSIVDPDVMLNMAGTDDSLADIASEARERLVRALSAIG
jgi:uncharacterized protein (DUF302 family)